MSLKTATDIAISAQSIIEKKRQRPLTSHKLTNYLKCMIFCYTANESASKLVIGRPITQAIEPRDTVAKILLSIAAKALDKSMPL